MTPSFPHAAMSLRQVLFQASGRLLALATLASLGGGAAAVGLVATINQALSTAPDALLPLGLRFAALAVLVLVCRTVSLMLFVRLNQTVLARLRAHIGARMLAAPYRDLERLGGGQGLTLLGDDTNQVAALLVAMPFLVMNGTIVIGCLTYLAWLSWQVFALSIVAVLAGSMCYQATRRRSQRYLREAGTWQDALTAGFSAIFTGAKELKLNQARRHAFLSGPLADAIEQVRARRTRGLSLLYLSLTLGSTLFFVVIGIILFVVQRPLGADAAVASGYTLVFLYMMAPLEGLLNSLPQLQMARVACQRIDQATAGLESDAATLAQPAAPHGAFQSLTLQGVTHRYRRESEDASFLLGPIDLTLRPAEVVFLVGGNGSGKTTLAKVLVGLYPPEGGTVRLNGREVADGAGAALHREQCTAVFSDFHLFESLMGVARDGIDARANRLVERLQLQNKVSVQDGAFSTRALSQGQRKRLALVAACLEDRPVIVLDEWAADQDPAFKAIFYREILAELRAQGKAVLVISHDDRYFDCADRIVWLENGQLADRAPSPAPSHAEAKVA